MATGGVEFTDDEDEIDNKGGFNFKSAAMYLEKPKTDKRKDGRILAVVDKTNYWKATEANRPDTAKARRLGELHKQCRATYKKHQEEQANAYGDD